MKFFRKIEESHCANPTETQKAAVYSQDTLVKSLQRSEGLLWQKDVSDPYHHTVGQKFHSPPTMDFIPPGYDNSPRNIRPRTFEQPRLYDSPGSGHYSRFEQQLSPRERMDMQGQKRYRS
jgi:hypothetical protein